MMKSNLLFGLKFFCIILLGLSFLKLPIGYYTFLRIIVTGTAIYSAYIYYVKENKVWIVVFSLIAIVFNPIIPIYLNKNIWSIIDIITALFFSISIFIFKENNSIKNFDNV